MNLTTLSMGPRALAFVLSDHGRISFETVTIAAGAGILKPGTVLGQVTASKKFVPSPAASASGLEGAETAKAVLAYGVDATSADVIVVVMRRLGEVKKPMLVFEASVDTAPEIAAKLDQLAASFIIAR